VVEEHNTDNELLLEVPLLLMAEGKSDSSTQVVVQTLVMAIPIPKIKKAKASAPPDPMSEYLRLFPGISTSAVGEVLSHFFAPSRVGEVYARAVQFEGDTHWIQYVNHISKKLALQDEELTFGRRALLVPKEWPMRRSADLMVRPFFDWDGPQLHKWWALEELPYKARGYICLFSLMIAEQDLTFAFQSKDHLFASLLRKVLHQGDVEKKVISYVTNEVWYNESLFVDIEEHLVRDYAMWSLPMVVGYDLNSDSGLINPELPEFTNPRLFDGVEEGLMFWITRILDEYHRLRATLSDTEYVRNLPRSLLEEYGMIQLPTSRVASVAGVIQSFHGLQGYVDGIKFISQMNDEPYVLHPIYQKICVAVRRIVEEYKKMHFFEERDGTTILQKAAVVHNADVQTLARVVIQTHLLHELSDIEIHLEHTSSCAGERPAEVTEEAYFEESDVDDDDEAGEWHDVDDVNQFPPLFDAPQW
jgi:hypothetical protein